MRFEAGWDLGDLWLAEACCPQAGTSSPPHSVSSSWKELSSPDGIPEPWSRLRASFKMPGQWVVAGLSWDRAGIYIRVNADNFFFLLK